MVTLGTVTDLFLNNLEKERVILSEFVPEQIVVVYLHLTRKGRLVHRLHKRFHKAMVEKNYRGYES